MGRNGAARTSSPVTRTRAKQRGYYWKDGKGPWVRNFKEDEVEREMWDAPFLVERYAA
jgi:hypothetical protein